MISFPFGIFTENEDFPIHIQYGFHDTDMYEHCHENFSEMVIVLNGSARHIVNGESYPISAGDVFVINQSVSHGFCEPDKLTICNIMVQPEKVFDRVHDMTSLPGFQSLFFIEPQYYAMYGFLSQLKLGNEEFSAIRTMIRSINSEYSLKQPGWRDSVFAQFYSLCIACSRFYKQENSDVRNNFLRLADVAAYIENNYTTQLSTERLAEISGYSQRQFLRMFKNVYSETPNSYITDLRIKKAKLLLTSTDSAIGDIAFECGYSDQNYFSRLFLKKTGMSPSAYRSAAPEHNIFSRTEEQN